MGSLSSKRVAHGKQREEGRRAVDTDEADRDESTPRDGHGGPSDCRNRRRAIRVWPGTGRDGPTSERGRLLLPEPPVLRAVPDLPLLVARGLPRSLREGGRSFVDLGEVHLRRQGAWHLLPQPVRNLKLLDLKGNPVVVSGVVFWSIVGVKAAVLNVENVSRYPYEADDEGEALPSSQHRHGLSLKTEAAQVS